MKSLGSNTENGCPFNSRFFTKKVVKHLLNEEFGWRDHNDSYADFRELDVTGCYKKYVNGNGADIYIYICEDGIEIDEDYDCGGNLNTQFIEFDSSLEDGYEAFEEAYDKMVGEINRIKR
jgi:hypothetical protein